MTLKEMNMAACFFVGSVILSVAVYSLATEINFIHNAIKLDAPIVDVRREYVPKGKGSILAYVPIVEVPNSGNRISIDTYSEQSIYSIGSKVHVLCDFAVSKKRIRNTFFETWGNSVVNFVLSLLFLLPALFYFQRLKQKRKDQLS